MANKRDNGLLFPHFFKIVFKPESGQMKLPSRFVEEHGNNLSNYAFIHVSSTGAKLWKMKVKREEGNIWLHKGWQEFVKYYFIKSGHFLLFRYEGESKFRVFIFDTSTMEIEYHAQDARSSSIELESDDEEDDDDNEEDECMESIPCGNRSSEEKGQHSASANDKVLEKANAFESPNPSFMSIMQPYHLSPTRACLYVPKDHGKTHFLEKENNGIYLSNGEDEGVWFVKYSTYGTPFRVRLSSTGWRSFIKENHLELGDACVFELVDSSTMAYKITIFRVSDYA